MRHTKRKYNKTLKKQQTSFRSSIVAFERRLQRENRPVLPEQGPTYLFARRKKRRADGKKRGDKGIGTGAGVSALVISSSLFSLTDFLPASVAEAAFYAEKKTHLVKAYFAFFAERWRR